MIVISLYQERQGCIYTPLNIGVQMVSENNIRNDIFNLLHESIITDNEVYPLIFIAYIINKYNLNMDVKFDSYITFISYIKENIENLSYSTEELNILMECLNKLIYCISDSNLKKVIKFIEKSERLELIDLISSLQINTKYICNISESLSKLVLRLLNKNGTLLDMNCGNGDFLINAININNNYVITGYEKNIDRLLNVRIRMLMLNNSCHFENSSVLEFSDNSKSYDSIFCLPPFGLRINDNMFTNNFEVKKINSSEWYYVDKIISLLNPKGKAIIILPKLPMFKNPDSKIREYLIKNRLVEAIIELPERIFNCTSIGTIMLVISKNNNYIRLIDATNMYYQFNKINNEIDVDKIYDSYLNDSDKSKNISINQFEEKGYSFIPSNYINNVKSKMKNPKLLKDYITIIRGYRGKGNAKTEEKCKIIKLSNIGNGKIKKEELEEISYDSSMEKFIIHDKDIIITARGSRFESAIVRIKDGEKIICGEWFFLIRVINNNLNSYYLNLYLNSSLGQEAIFTNQIKSVCLIINANGLLNTYIDVISKEKQDEIEQLEIEKSLLEEKIKKEINEIDKRINNILK